MTEVPCPRPKCKGILIQKQAPLRYVCGMCNRVYSADDRRRIAAGKLVTL